MIDWLIDLILFLSFYHSVGLPAYFCPFILCVDFLFQPSVPVSLYLTLMGVLEIYLKTVEMWDVLDGTGI